MDVMIFYIIPIIYSSSVLTQQETVPMELFFGSNG